MPRITRSTRRNHPRIQDRLRSATLLPLLLSAAFSLHAQIPAVVFSQTSGITGIGSAAGVIDYSGTASQIAANSRGDIFVNVSENNAAFVLEQPANGGAQVELVSGMGNPYGAHSIYIDKFNNVYAPDAGDATILYIPFVNGTYPANAVFSSLSACTAFPVPSTQTTTCKVPLSYPGSLGYYVSAGAIGLDGVGNLYILSKYTGGGTQYPGADVLMQVLAKDGSFHIISGKLQNDSGAQIAVNKAGDIFEVNYGSVTEFPASNYASPVGVPSLNNPNGVSMDANGNLFITNNGAGSILEYPYVNGTYNLSSLFTVSNQLGSGYTGKASQGVAIDGFGKIDYAGDYPNSLSSLTLGSLTFAPQALATTSGSSTLNVVFNAAETFGVFSTSGPAGAFSVSSNTCTKGAAFAVASNCAVTLTYTATAAGPQSAQLLAYDNSGNLIGHATLRGSGLAPVLSVDPGTASTIGSAWTAPSAIAVDAVGTVYVADTSSGSIYKTAAGSTIRTAVATGFSTPSAVAVDAAGNLYIGDSGNSQVVQLPYLAASSTYGPAQILVTSLSGVSALALDSLGDLYVCDSGNGRVLRLASSGSLPLGSLVTSFGTGFITPVAIAVDSTGQNVYVSDKGANQVVQVNVPSSIQTAILTAMTTPAGVAVDATGSLYAVDSGAATITRVPSIGGVLNKNFQATLGTVVKLPNSIATDPAGNLYVTDTTDALVAIDLRSAGLLNFGNVNVLASSSTVSAQLSNGGTAGLTLSTPYYTASGSTTSFTIQSSSTCAPGAALPPGQFCTVAASFTPLTRGTQGESLALASNAPAATLLLTGSGTLLTKSTLALAITAPATPPTFGQAITIGATLTPQPGGVGSPSGTVTFLVDGSPQPAVTLSGTTASITLSGLTGGLHSITASYSGDSNYASSASSALGITIGTSTTTISANLTTPYTSPAAANPLSSTAANPASQQITFTAIVTPALPGTPTGSVTFFSGTTALGTATVTPVQVNGKPAGQAIYTSPGLALGVYPVTAAYSGDSNYSISATTTSLPLLISNPTITMTTSSTSITGGGGQVTLTLTSIAGFGSGTNASNTAALACSGLPLYSTCSFSPPFAVVVAGAPAQIALSVLINQPPVIAVPNSLAPTPHLPGHRRTQAILALLLLLPMALLGLRIGGSRRNLQASLLRPTSLLALLLLAATAAALSGCGSGSSAAFLTPRGTTPFTVTATISQTPPTPNPPPTQTLKLQLTVNE